MSTDLTGTDLTGTVALITGATSGIGKATAFAFANRGAHVLVGGRDAARAEAVVTSLRARGAKADFIDVDLGSSDSARRAAELGDGHVDILVNNAAIFPMGPDLLVVSVPRVADVLFPPGLWSAKLFDLQ